jgi:hypothetical protein
MLDGVPVVDISDCGRTSKSATGEGADQSEGSEYSPTRDRLKTMLTATEEGIDQAGEGIENSAWGRTTMTKSTGEGADASEAAELCLGAWGRTAQTRSSEGIDACETVEFGESRCCS